VFELFGVFVVVLSCVHNVAAQDSSTAYVAMSLTATTFQKMHLSQESCLQKLPEYKRMISVMSDSQLRTELSTLETLKTQVLKKQEDEAASNRELHAALKKEGEELEDQRRKKRQFIRLKETVEGPTQHGRIGPSWPSTQNAIEALESSFPELETLASLKKKGRHEVHAKILDEIRTAWPKSTAMHAKILDEITAARAQELATESRAKAIASRARELAKAQVKERLRQQKLES